MAIVVIAAIGLLNVSIRENAFCPALIGLGPSNDVAGELNEGKGFVFNPATGKYQCWFQSESPVGFEEI